MYEELDQKIISEVSKDIVPIQYSELRKFFDESDFVDRVCFLITTEKIFVPGWNDKSEYPEEATQINKTLQSYDSEYTTAVHENDTGQVSYDYLTGREISVQGQVDKTLDPLLLYKPYLRKFLEYLEENATWEDMIVEEF